LGEFWGETAIETLQPPLSKKVKGADKVRRMFAYMACVYLAAKGWLNQHNVPSAECLRAGPAACVGWPLEQEPLGRRLPLGFAPAAMDVEPDLATVEPDPVLQGCALCDISSFTSPSQREAHLVGVQHWKQEQKMAGAQHRRQEQKQSLAAAVDLDPAMGCALCDISSFTSSGQLTQHLAGTQHWKRERQRGATPMKIC
jgi:hypothetical protein